MSESASEKLQKADLKGLGMIMGLSHAVLGRMGVSSGRLDRLVDASMSLGAYGSKLTGGGGGGSVVSVAPEGKQKSIISGLSALGFESFRAEIPARGVRSWLER